MPDLAVTFIQSEDYSESDLTLKQATIDLAAELRLPVLQPEELQNSQYKFVLQNKDSGLELLSLSPSHPGPIRADFENPTLAYRINNKVYSQAIIRAVGVKPGLIPSVLDATAGLGKDAYLLATAGCAVHMLERNRIIHALLRDGLLRASQSTDSNVRAAVELMQLSLISLAQFATTAPSFDVVYLDPMFPSRRKSAQVKKDMFILQKFFEESESDAEDSDMLIDALAIARHRVVVKRPLRAPDIAGKVPTFRLAGRSSRYDVYITG